jgi:hypothetical protein
LLLLAGLLLAALLLLARLLLAALLLATLLLLTGLLIWILIHVFLSTLIGDATSIARFPWQESIRGLYICSRVHISNN